MKNIPKLLTLKGAEITPYITSIAKLEMDMLSEFPYLYAVDLDEQINYVKRFAECEQSVVVLVMHKDKVVGLATGMPLSFDGDFFKKPFIENGIDIKSVFYFGEALLLPEYRGQGIYRHFFAKREAAALEHDCTMCVFASVERPLDDPRKPKNYTPLDPVWQHFGYEKHSNLSLEVEWRDVGDEKPSKKKWRYWYTHP